MKVSVLVPVYGVERYIAQCATTLMEQTYKDVEYIFVDDCTPDASVERLQEVLDSYPERQAQVRVIGHDQNKGLAGARLTALNAATGDAVIIVDSDDYVAPAAIERLVAEMERTGADVVDGGYGMVSNGITTERFMPLHRSEKAYLRTILCQNVEPNRIWGRLIKKSLFDDHGIIFHQGIDYSEDFTVLPLLLLHAKRAWVDECLYFYRNDNPESYTNNITVKNAVSFLKAQQLVGTAFKQSNQWRTYATAAQIGWVNVWRFARRFGVDGALVDEHFHLLPTHLIMRCLAAMMRSRVVPFKVANFVYKGMRRIYLNFAASN
ncbi:MAG: glycosyltransferase family 2 protein [Muribaculaceae bacterium]|nr:glycosyltransferase family 2 protein [Muribaculaceae bacterium]